MKRLFFLKKNSALHSQPLTPMARLSSLLWHLTAVTHWHSASESLGLPVHSNCLNNLFYNLVLCSPLWTSPLPFLHMTSPLSALLLVAGAALVAAQGGPGPGGPWDASLFLHSNATAERLNAYCLDGSNGGFYYRPASSPAARTKWKLHFMGGGWATAPEWLLTRSRGSTGSSKAWGPWLGTYWGFFGLDSLNDTSVNIVGDWNFVWFFVRALYRPP